MTQSHPAGTGPDAVIADLKQRAGRLGMIAFSFSIVINLLLLVSPIYMLQIYDRVLASGSGATLFYLTLAAIALLGALGALEHYRSQLLIRFGTELSRTLDQRLFRGALGAFNRPTTGNPTQPMRDLDTLTGFLSQGSATNLMDAPWAPFFLAIIFLMHPWLGIVATSGALVLGVLAVMTETTSRAPLKAAHRHRSQSMGYVDRTLRNASVIESMGMGGPILKRWLGTYREAAHHQAVAAERSGGIKAVIKFLRPSLQAAMLGTGAWLALRGDITAGTIVAASIISSRALAPIEQAVGNWKQVVAARDAYGRLIQFLTRHCPAKAEGVVLPRPEGALTVETLAGGPPGARTPVVQGLNFSLVAGQFLGIAGPSGAGKSTLASLLVGIWQPLQGAVRLDGADIYHWDKDHLGPHLGFLPQDTDLFEGTIAQNIARFGPVDSDAVLEAAKLSGVHEMILQFPQGYETLVGAGGLWLSAGQRQRIYLARAIYRRPALLVLDEPNSHLDAAGEADLIQTLKSVTAWGSTIVLICHRPPLLALADTMMILRDGRMQVLGPTAEVMKRLVGPAPQAARVLTPSHSASRTPSEVVG